ncbi:hypothetical protein EO763_07635 [Pectobacterium odoriferum]|uniref:hypothetical protein n=1 Tax=Pectobacterium odoriferum TaxID=78398 RepID=UPI0013744595|nr:hypothetical protein [Pectobacterium odoriferum]QHP79814.1 hypothetical protein EO763_07635 [Pectobacterium odoriferum]
MIDIIANVLNDKVKVALIKTQKGSLLKFTEDSPSSKINKIEIEDIPDNSIAFTLDYNDPSDRSFKKLSPYFNPENDIGINKSCDLVILSIKNTQNDDGSQKAKADVLVTDFKSDTVGPRGAIQIENSILFVDYIIKLLEKFYSLKINPCFIRRIISTHAKKKPIGTKNKTDRSILRIVSVSVDKQKKCTLKYSRIIS